MKFARIIFLIAGIWGVLVLTPLYFMFDRIGQQDPPPITHPGFYYGFVSVGLAWQIAFLIISRNPVRLRPLMIAAVLEKFGYVASLAVLYAQARVHGMDMLFAGIDCIFGVLFIVSFFKTSPSALHLAR